MNGLGTNPLREETLATTAGSSPPLVFFASTSSKVRRPDA
jgi:hypothetical protein